MVHRNGDLEACESLPDRTRPTDAHEGAARKRRHHENAPRVVLSACDEGRKHPENERNVGKNLPRGVRNRRRRKQPHPDARIGCAVLFLQVVEPVPRLGFQRGKHRHRRWFVGCGRLREQRPATHDSHFVPLRCQRAFRRRIFGSSPRRLEPDAREICRLFQATFRRRRREIRRTQRHSRRHHRQAQERGHQRLPLLGAEQQSGRRKRCFQL